MAQIKKCLKVLKVAHVNLLEWFEIAMYRCLWWTLWNNLVFRDLEAHALSQLSTSGGKQKMGKRKFKRAITVIIMLAMK